MAILFDENNRASYIGNVHTTVMYRYAKILIYSGTQPTTTAYEANWGTNYYYDFGTTNYGSQLLCMYGDKTTGNSTDLAISRTNTTLYTTDSTVTKDYFQDGTASWAVMMSVEASGVWAGAATPRYFTDITQASGPATYVIVPCTQQTGDGVIKLQSLSITSSVPDLYAVDLSIS